MDIYEITQYRLAKLNQLIEMIFEPVHAVVLIILYMYIIYWSSRNRKATAAARLFIPVRRIHI